MLCFIPPKHSYKFVVVFCMGYMSASKCLLGRAASEHTESLAMSN